MTEQVDVKPRLLSLYREEVVSRLREEFQYKNIMQIPKMEKIVINMGVKDAIGDVKILDSLQADLAVIAGQRPVVTRAKKSIAAFKLRQGMPIGLKVTIRGMRMYEFMDRLFNVAMPRIRDFRGYSIRGFDGRGNFTLGIQEHIIFPEVEYEKVRKIHGMDITFVTTARTDQEAKRLLEWLGLPFEKR